LFLKEKIHGKMTVSGEINSKAMTTQNRSLITEPVNSNEPSGFAASPAMAFYSWIQVATRDICLAADPTFFRVVEPSWQSKEGILYLCSFHPPLLREA